MTHPRYLKIRKLREILLPDFCVYSLEALLLPIGNNLSTHWKRCFRPMERRLPPIGRKLPFCCRAVCVEIRRNIIACKAPYFLICSKKTPY